APTPGGAGIAEGASLSVMAGIVPSSVAPFYNLLWRVSTAYLAALAGFVSLGWALARDASTITSHHPEPRRARPCFARSDDDDRRLRPAPGPGQHPHHRRLPVLLLVPAQPVPERARAAPDPG